MNIFLLNSEYSASNAKLPSTYLILVWNDEQKKIKRLTNLFEILKRVACLVTQFWRKLRPSIGVRTRLLDKYQRLIEIIVIMYGLVKWLSGK